MTSYLGETTATVGQERRPHLGIVTIVAMLAPGLVVFALPAVDLIARNGEFFGGDFSAGRDLYFLAVPLILVGFGLWAAAVRVVGRFMFICHLLITPGWLAYTTLGDWRRAFGGVMVGLAILATAWLIHRRNRVTAIGGVGLFGVLLLIGSIVTTVLEVRRDPGGEESGSPVASAAPAPSAELPNIYHVVMDEYQTQMFETTLDESVREALAGFTYLPDTRTTYGRTEMSMASILGPSDYDYTTTPQDFVDASLRGPESSLQLLRQIGYRITGFTHIPSLYGSPSPFDEAVLFEDYVDFDPGDEYTRLANSLWVFAYMPGSIAQLLLPEDHYAQLTGQNLLPDDAPPVSALSFETFINRERQESSTGRYTLMHLILPHFPYVMSADCGYTEGAESTPADQAACATSLIIALVEELKALDRFESSVIVIHGDHGARFEVRSEELVRLPNDFFSEQWSDARSRPLLLIKPAGSDASSFRISDYEALLTDIMPTIFDSLDVPFVAHDARVSLLQGDLPRRGTRYYHFYEKGDDGLPDGELTRFIIDNSEIRYDTSISVPTE
ncbi:MAG: hypothetical protein WD269_09905 [Acidimicrobiia bacterium]